MASLFRSFHPRAVVVLILLPARNHHHRVLRVGGLPDLEQPSPRPGMRSCLHRWKRPQNRGSGHGGGTFLPRDRQWRAFACSGPGGWSAGSNHARTSCLWKGPSDRHTGRVKEIASKNNFPKREAVLFSAVIPLFYSQSRESYASAPGSSGQLAWASGPG